jgi:dihydroorotase
MEGIKRITLLPAQRVQNAAPAMKRKGRLRVGMDADITVFDPVSVQERATYDQPDQRSAGIPWVIVNGQVVIADGRAAADAAPGRWVGYPRR